MKKVHIYRLQNVENLLVLVIQYLCWSCFWFSSLNGFVVLLHLLDKDRNFLGLALTRVLLKVAWGRGVSL